MLNKMVSALVFLLITVCLNAAAFPVNESVGEYKISFEYTNNMNYILSAQMWNSEDILGGELGKMIDGLGVAKVVGAMVGLDKKNYSQNVVSAVGVLILNESVNTTDAELRIIKNLDSKYRNIAEITIDGHEGFYIRYGNVPDDSYMERIGLYWLDESRDGMASELVVLASRSEFDIMTLMLTTHVEKLADV
jgi:hypothetical protein